MKRLSRQIIILSLHNLHLTDGAHFFSHPQLRHIRSLVRPNLFQLMCVATNLDSIFFRVIGEGK